MSYLLFSFLVLITNVFASVSKHNCALSDKNQVKCWGANQIGQLGYGDNLNRGSYNNSMGDFLPEVSFGSNFTPAMLSLGNLHTCVISVQHTIKCFGYNNWSLGANGLTDIYLGDSPDQTPDKIPIGNIGDDFIPAQMCSGLFYNCALSQHKTAKCWGRNAFGQLGYDDTMNRGDYNQTLGNNLKEIILPLDFIPEKIYCGGRHNCLLSNKNKVVCWGDNTSGQLGYSDIISRYNITDDILFFGHEFDVKSLSLGCYHSCAISYQNTVKCWGNNDHGQVGYSKNQTIINNTVPVIPNDTLYFSDDFIPTSIHSGAFHNCAVSLNGKVKCWGSNNHGQLGYDNVNNVGDDFGELGNAWNNVYLGIDFNVTNMYLGWEFTCAISQYSNIKCWGNNGDGSLGYQDNMNRGNKLNDMENLGNINLGSNFTPIFLYNTSPLFTFIPTNTPTMNPNINTFYPSILPSKNLINSPTESTSNLTVMSEIIILLALLCIMVIIILIFCCFICSKKLKLMVESLSVPSNSGVNKHNIDANGNNSTIDIFSEGVVHQQQNNVYDSEGIKNTETTNSPSENIGDV